MAFGGRITHLYTLMWVQTGVYWQESANKIRYSSKQGEFYDESKTSIMRRSPKCHHLGDKKLSCRTETMRLPLGSVWHRLEDGILRTL